MIQAQETGQTILHDQTQPKQTTRVTRTTMRTKTMMKKRMTQTTMKTMMKRTKTTRKRTKLDPTQQRPQVTKNLLKQKR